MPCTNNKDADQPAHMRSLISAFVVCCLESIIPQISISEISSLYLASVAVQAGLSRPWSQTRKTDFLVTWLMYIITSYIHLRLETYSMLKQCTLIRPIRRLGADLWNFTKGV